jgi:hypothetical protein
VAIRQHKSAEGATITSMLVRAWQSVGTDTGEQLWRRTSARISGLMTDDVVVIVLVIDYLICRNVSFAEAFP